jgi:PAS domain S-box-containing protein
MIERKSRRRFVADKDPGEIALQGAAKAVLDRCGSDRFVDTAKSGYSELKGLIQKWRRGRTLYAVTSRVPPTGAAPAEEPNRLGLSDSEVRSRALADTAPVMIWISGPDKLCTWFNQAWLNFVGRSMEQELGNGWVENLHRDDFSLCFETYLHAFDARLPFTRSYRLKRHDGQYRWVLDKAIPLFGSAGNFTGYMGCCMDITEQKRVEESLREADRRKDEFVANMSHEIRSPMTSILAHADLLLSHLQDPNDIDCVKSIKQGGNHLLELIGDILDLSKLEAGKLKIRRERVSLPTMLNEVHALMAVRAQEKGLSLILNFEGVIPEFLETDRTRVRQILLNLISNAIKFTEQGRVQTLARFHARESALEIEVADTGIGIPKEQQERLFQPFVQAEGVVSRDQEGTGLGLAITKRLLDMMGGEISFESTPNHGSAFRIRIPCASAAAMVAVQASEKSAPGKLAPGPAINCRILVADDRDEIRYLLRLFLERAGGQVVAVSDGLAAIEAVQKARAEGAPIDIAILDVQMPGLDGHETTRRLRAEGFTNPIIGLTAGAMRSDRESCLQAGFDSHLSKPIDQPTLLEIIRRYTQKSRDEDRTNRGALSCRTIGR